MTMNGRTKPVPLTGFTIERDFGQAGDVVIFNRALPEPKNELIIEVTALSKKAREFEQAGRPNDATMMRIAHQAYTASLRK